VYQNVLLVAFYFTYLYLLVVARLFGLIYTQHVSIKRLSIERRETKTKVMTPDRAEKCLRTRHFRPSRRDSWRENIDLSNTFRMKNSRVSWLRSKISVSVQVWTVVFRRYVLALLLVVLLRKFEAYLVYLSLILTKFPRCFSCFQKFRHFSYMFPVFPARISDMRNRLSALSSLRPIAKNTGNAVNQSKLACSRRGARENVGDDSRLVWFWLLIGWKSGGDF